MSQAAFLLVGELLILSQAALAAPDAPGLPTAPEAPAVAANEPVPAGSPDAADAGWERRRRRERTIPPPEELEARGAVIGEITIHVGDIFDPNEPGEKNRVFQLANRLNIRTRDKVVARNLLFRTGDLYSHYRVEESARILRAQPYLYDAEIRPVRYEGNRVDLEVVTRDVWTLKLGLGLSRSGGENATTMEVQDTNFLGMGREIALKRKETVDRTAELYRFRDFNLAGTRAELELSFSDNSDGSRRKFELNRPFFSLESRWAAGVEAVAHDRIDSIYNLGKITDRFQHEQTFVEIYGGLSKGLEGDRSRRWLAGFTFLEDRFGLPAGLPVPTTPLADRTLAYPWIGFQSLGDRFYETHNLNLMGRTEDLELGHRFFGRLGFSSPLFGGDDDEAVFDTRMSYSAMPAEDHLLYLSGRASGRWDGRQEEDLRLSAAARYYWRNFGDHLFYVGFEMDAWENPDPEHQLLLGGDSGLRGYPLRYQDGDRRVLVTVEQRFFTNWHIFKLAYVGAAIFVDAGRAWFTGFEPESDQGILTNIGVGLRLSPSRSGFGSMLHFDVAFPLGGDSSIDKVQWLVSTKESF